MEDCIFREYDIRGTVGSELIIDEVYALTQAIAYYIKKHNAQAKTIVVGMDGRVHSPAIKAEMCQALTDSGFDVVFVGVCTTPALYFALHTLKIDSNSGACKLADAGLMITASHNAKEYNGIKICLGTKSIWGKEIRVIRDLYKEKKQVTAEKGALSEHAIIPDYVAWLGQHFAHLQNIDIPIVIDCGNGAAGTVIPALIEKMGWKQARLLYADVDGTYPNHEADPTVEKNMQEVRDLLLTTDAALGIGLDGDADRMAAMTKQGFLVPGDQLLALFAQPIIAQNAGAGIVFDIKSSRGLNELVVLWGGVPIVSPSGHAIIKDKMKRQNALLGGELSCHFFFADRYFGYDDGVYALLRLVELLQKSGKTLEQLLAVFPKKYSTREFRIACADDKKERVIKAVFDAFKVLPNAQIMTIDGVHVSLPYGWGIVRPSNTQPVLSIRFEADTPADLSRIKEQFIQVLQPLMHEINLVTVLE